MAFSFLPSIPCNNYLLSNHNIPAVFQTVHAFTYLFSQTSLFTTSCRISCRSGKTPDFMWLSGTFYDNLIMFSLYITLRACVVCTGSYSLYTKCYFEYKGYSCRSCRKMPSNPLYIRLSILRQPCCKTFALRR